MRFFRNVCAVFLLLLSLTGCGSGGAEEVVDDKNLGQIMAAKTPYALAKTATPVLNTHDWDSVFGGATGADLKYDRFGEVDELVFVALPGTFFNLQRQVRKETRAGMETIYYKVNTPDYGGSEPLWIDGRFLDLRDIKPTEQRDAVSVVKTLIQLRSYKGLPYTWHGSSSTGAPELLHYYVPKENLSFREESDWILKGFSSLGMLYEASGGQTPVDEGSLARFGTAVFVDIGAIEAEEGEDLPLKKTKALMAILQPLDIIHMDDRVWIVLDKSEIIQTRYSSKFAGKVVISSLIDTIHGLLTKGTLVEDPLQELEGNAKKFYIRRYANTDNLLLKQLTEDEDSGEVEATEGEENAEEEVAPLEEEVE